jgi:hypothetical protein
MDSHSISILPRWAKVPIRALLVAAAAGACSSGGAGALSTGGSGDANKFIDDYVAAVCSVLDACCQKNNQPPPGSTCTSTLGAEVHQSFGSSTVQIDANAADACLAAIRAQSATCPSNFTDAPACKSVGSSGGTVPPGGPCANGSECSQASGDVVCLHWSSSGGDGGTTSGTICQQRITSALGGQCDTGGHEAQSYVCNKDLGHVCVNGKCEAGVPAGGSCANGERCSSGNSCTSGTCQPNKVDWAKTCVMK